MLTLRQTVYLSRGLSLCARNVWLQHEQGHVRDNERLMPRMDRELRADAQFAAILVSPTGWRPRADFQRTQQMIQQRAADVFGRLTQHAARGRDTRAEYQRAERQVRVRCGQILGRILKQGMSGNGIDIVQNALNNQPPTSLPLLVVDGIFGPRTDARVREFQRHQGLNDDGIVGPRTRAALSL